jgi:hypothetical protein
MSQIIQTVEVLINGAQVAFEEAHQTGRSIKERACIPGDHILCLDRKALAKGEDCGCEGGVDELKVIADDDVVILEHGQHFLSHAPAAHHGVTVMINKQPFEFAEPHQTGRSIKERAGIPIADVLFLDRPGEDEVIGDDKKIVLKSGDCFHSSPPANYGGVAAVEAADVGYDEFEKLPQPGGWTFLIVPNFPVPDAYTPRSVRLLVKLPPLFPDAAPDMFWLSPHIRTASGAVPQGTSPENLVGADWQRFSWHLQPGAWRPGSSTLRDYMRCIRARLEKRN